MVSFDGVLIIEQHPPTVSVVVWKDDNGHIWAAKYNEKYDKWDRISKGESGIDDAEVIQKAIDVVGEQDGGLVKINSGTYLIDKTINMKNRVILSGNNTIFKLNKEVVCVNCDGEQNSENGWMNCGIENIIFDGNGNKYKSPLLLLHHIGQISPDFNEPTFFRDLTFRNHGGFVIRMIGQTSNIVDISNINVTNSAGRYTFTARDGSTQLCPIFHLIPDDNNGHVTDIHITNSHFEYKNGPLLYSDYLVDERLYAYSTGIYFTDCHIETSPDLSVVQPDMAYVFRGGVLNRLTLSNVLIAHTQSPGIPIIDIEHMNSLLISNTQITNPSPLIKFGWLGYANIDAYIMNVGTPTINDIMIRTNNILSNSGDALIGSKISLNITPYFDENNIFTVGICRDTTINIYFGDGIKKSKINITNIQNSGNIYTFGDCIGINNEGILTIKGDGTTTTFTVSTQHNLITDDPSKILVTATPSKSCQVEYNLVDNDGDGFKETLQFTLTFTTAPASGEIIYLSWNANVIM